MHLFRKSKIHFQVVVKWKNGKIIILAHQFIKKDYIKAYTKKKHFFTKKINFALIK